MLQHFFSRQLLLKKSRDVVILNEEQTALIKGMVSNLPLDIVASSVYNLTDKQKIAKAVSVLQDYKIYVNENLGIINSNFSGVYGKNYPMIVNFELTNYCNFKCPFCYKNACPLNTVFLDSEILYNFAEKYRKKIPLVHLTGGEPLSHPDINSILTKLLPHFLVNITTNLSLLHRIDIDLLNKINNFQVSLYGFDVESYKINTGISAFNQVEKNLRFLIKEKIPHYVMLLATPFVIENAEKYKSLLNKLGETSVRIEGVNGFGRASEDFFDDNAIADLRDRMNGNTEEEFNVLTSNSTSCMYPRCGAGSYQITINESGYIVPCIQLSYPEFYMDRYDNFDKFINTSQEKAFVKLMHKNKLNFSNYCSYMEDLK